LLPLSLSGYHYSLPLPKTDIKYRSPLVRLLGAAKHRARIWLPTVRNTQQLCCRHRWFENKDRELKILPNYFIDYNLVSNKDYSAFIKATQHSAPYADRVTWQQYKLAHPYNTAQKHGAIIFSDKTHIVLTMALFMLRTAMATKTVSPHIKCLI